MERSRRSYFKKSCERALRHASAVLFISAETGRGAWDAQSHVV